VTWGEMGANLAVGAMCRANMLLAMLGMTATLTLKDNAQIFAGLATGCWFTLQFTLAILDRLKKRRHERGRRT